jgi:hypothetical protein
MIRPVTTDADCVLAAGTVRSGGVESFLIVTLLLVVPPRDVAWHVSVVPAVSSVTAAGVHPVAVKCESRLGRDRVAASRQVS